MQQTRNNVSALGHSRPLQHAASVTVLSCVSDEAKPRVADSCNYATLFYATNSFVVKRLQLAGYAALLIYHCYVVCTAVSKDIITASADTLALQGKAASTQCAYRMTCGTGIALAHVYVKAQVYSPCNHMHAVHCHQRTTVCQT
eukprot:21084-Heterococcus_DN1.PRE.7